MKFNSAINILRRYSLVFDVDVLFDGQINSTHLAAKKISEESWTVIRIHRLIQDQIREWSFTNEGDLLLNLSAAKYNDKLTIIHRNLKGLFNYFELTRNSLVQEKQYLAHHFSYISNYLEIILGYGDRPRDWLQQYRKNFTRKGTFVLNTAFHLLFCLIMILVMSILLSSEFRAWALYTTPSGAVEIDNTIMIIALVLIVPMILCTIIRWFDQLLLSLIVISCFSFLKRIQCFDILFIIKKSEISRLNVTRAELDVFKTVEISSKPQNNYHSLEKYHRYIVELSTVGIAGKILYFLAYFITLISILIPTFIQRSQMSKDQMQKSIEIGLEAKITVSIYLFTLILGLIPILIASFRNRLLTIVLKKDSVYIQLITNCLIINEILCHNKYSAISTREEEADKYFHIIKRMFEKCIELLQCLEIFTYRKQLSIIHKKMAEFLLLSQMNVDLARNHIERAKQLENSSNDIPLRSCCCSFWPQGKSLFNSVPLTIDMGAYSSVKNNFVNLSRDSHSAMSLQPNEEVSDDPDTEFLPLIKTGNLSV